MNIKFTFEMGKDKSLAFLDINIQRGSNKFENTSILENVTYVTLQTVSFI